MNITERFLKYITFDTQSDEASASCPSTSGQRVFAAALAKELEEIGLTDISLDENAYLMATLPATAEGDSAVTGFIAHLDTSPDMSGRNVNARIVKYEAGGDIVLSAENGITLSPDLFPELAAYEGQDIIVTDGTTLLGADDKAGIAAIISAMQYLVQHPEIKHGKIRIAFTPDEEIGRGADRFDVERFGCDWAYTIDGGAIGELEYENFNAAVAKVSFNGRNIHPGMAKGKMINAALLASEFVLQLPKEMRPENTENYEGFFHVTDLRADVELAVLTILIRDHDRALFEAKKDLLLSLVAGINSIYNECAQIQIIDQYYNMYEVLASHRHIIDLAAEAMRAAGVKPLIKPIRGGTDGARLSFMGLPCPNIFAGGHNFHGRYEFLPVLSMEKSMNTIIKIVELSHIIK
ncbi:MAG: peptidase T [Tannerellaceae bacterium]|jgi:tripeptide aminopeptidase|nr:peptidase T [Tannerellaceae bacterium]